MDQNKGSCVTEPLQKDFNVGIGYHVQLRNYSELFYAFHHENFMIFQNSMYIAFYNRECFRYIFI